MGTPEIIVHHLERSRSHRVVWALEELALPYRVETYRRNPETMRADPALAKLHPLGKAPVVSIDGVVFAESGAILEELADVAAANEGATLRPAPGTEAHRRYRYFLHYAEGSLMPPLLVALIVGQIRKAAVPFFLKPVVKGIAAKVDANFTSAELARNLAFLEGELSSRDYLCGDALTLADVQMSYPVAALLSRSGVASDDGGENEGPLSAGPALRAYHERISALPAYQRALEITGDEGLIPG